MAEAHGSPLRSQRLYDITGVTEGEMDLLIALTGTVSGEQTSPRKYADRLYKSFVRAAGYRAVDTDAYKLMNGEVRFLDYRSLARRPESPHVPAAESYLAMINTRLTTLPAAYKEAGLVSNMLAKFKRAGG